MKRYEPNKIEPKWQAIWDDTQIFQAPSNPQDKTYVIPMFPYPSGDGLHVGHPRPYTAADIQSHYQRLNGKQVLHAMGWDAFGLPAENAAIKKGVHPATNTAANIENFRRQLKSLGFSYDWSREVNTSDPNYYRWTQWIFVQLFKAGLAYRAEGWQWWCPNDKTVLANEQVIDGHCERCGAEVTKKQLTQWYFKVTKYADELLRNLDDLDWPESIKALQRNWIGRSEGAEITFDSPAGEITAYTTRPDTLFGTTYIVLAPEHPLVETLTDPMHKKAVDDYVQRTKTATEIARTATDKAKTGVPLGTTAIHPLTKEELPIWIADYVLPTYGTGAIMAVPAHDQRDHEFATKFKLPIRQVLEPFYVQETEPGIVRKDEPYDHRDAIIAVVKHWQEEKYLALRWKKVAWGTFVTGGIEQGQTATEAAIAEIKEETGYLTPELVEDYGLLHGLFYHVPKQVNRFAHARTMLLKLQDDSREKIVQDEQDKHEVLWLTADELQRFLTPATHQHALRYVMGTEGVHSGEGIMVHSGQHDGKTSAEARELIVKDLAAQQHGQPSVSYKLRDWLISRQRYWGTPIPIVHCPKCGPVAVPEDQLPVELPDVADYLPTGDGRSPLAKVSDFVNTTCPECSGPAERETDTMDTFADSSWYFLRYPEVSDDTQAWSPEAVKAWAPVDTYVGGADHAVLHLIYARFWTMALADLGHLTFREPFLSLRNHGMIHADDGNKMSKSKGNVVNPDEIVNVFGADTLRLYEMFIGPYDQAANWSSSGLEGIHRFLKRVWAFAQQLPGAAGDSASRGAAPDTSSDIALAAANRVLSQGIHNVTRSIEAFRFNTAVSALMETLNEYMRIRSESSGSSGLEWRTLWGDYLTLLAPFAPHLAEELWQDLGHQSSIFTGSWPVVDAAALQEDIVTVVVQVNGKVRATLAVATDALGEAEVTKLAQADSNVQRYLDGKAIRKTIYIPGKVLNLVV